MTTRSSPSRAMSPPTDSVNLHSSFTACLMSSMLFFASGLTLKMRMFPDLTSRLTVSTSSRLRRGRALR